MSSYNSLDFITNTDDPQILFQGLLNCQHYYHDAYLNKLFILADLPLLHTILEYVTIKKICFNGLFLKIDLTHVNIDRATIIMKIFSQCNSRIGARYPYCSTIKSHMLTYDLPKQWLLKLISDGLTIEPNIIIKSAKDKDFDVVDLYLKNSQLDDCLKVIAALSYCPDIDSFVARINIDYYRVKMFRQLIFLKDFQHVAFSSIYKCYDRNICPHGKKEFFLFFFAVSILDICTQVQQAEKMDMLCQMDKYNYFCKQCPLDSSKPNDDVILSSLLKQQCYHRVDRYLSLRDPNVMKTINIDTKLLNARTCRVLIYNGIILPNMTSDMIETNKKNTKLQASKLQTSGLDVISDVANIIAELKG